MELKHNDQQPCIPILERYSYDEEDWDYIIYKEQVDYLYEWLERLESFKKHYIEEENVIPLPVLHSLLRFDTFNLEDTDEDTSHQSPWLTNFEFSFDDFFSMSAELASPLLNLLESCLKKEVAIKNVETASHKRLYPEFFITQNSIFRAYRDSDSKKLHFSIQLEDLTGNTQQFTFNDVDPSIKSNEYIYFYKMITGAVIIKLEEVFKSGIVQVLESTKNTVYTRLRNKLGSDRSKHSFAVKSHHLIHHFANLPDYIERYDLDPEQSTFYIYVDYRISSGRTRDITEDTELTVRVCSNRLNKKFWIDSSILSSPHQLNMQALREYITNVDLLHCATDVLFQNCATDQSTLEEANIVHLQQAYSAELNQCIIDHGLSALHYANEPDIPVFDQDCLNTNPVIINQDFKHHVPYGYVLLLEYMTMLNFVTSEDLFYQDSVINRLLYTFNKVITNIETEVDELTITRDCAKLEKNNMGAIVTWIQQNRTLIVHLYRQFTSQRDVLQRNMRTLQREEQRLQEQIETLLTQFDANTEEYIDQMLQILANIDEVYTQLGINRQKQNELMGSTARSCSTFSFRPDQKSLLLKKLASLLYKSQNNRDLVKSLRTLADMIEFNRI
jgi:hypothetical protein